MTDLVLTAQPILSSALVPPITAIKESRNSLYIAQAVGIITELKKGVATTFLDIRSQVLSGGERGLLGLTFHGDKKSHFFIWYTEATPTGTAPPITPAPPAIPVWTNRTLFSHINRLEEWKIEDGVPVQVRTLLRIRHPFSNHNGLNNIFYDDKKNRLILATGDGGSGGDPFNLAQNDNELFGKLISIDLKDDAWDTITQPPAPVTQVSELGALGEVIKVVGKGIRNPTRLDEKDGLKFLSVAGESTREFAFAFESYKKNFGWRPFEGDIPTPITGTSTSRYPTEVVRLLATANLWKPIAAYANTSTPNLPSNVPQGNASTGIDFYDGKIKELRNHFILTDLSGAIFAVKVPDYDDEDELRVAQPVKILTVQGLSSGITTLYITKKNRILVALTNGQIVELTKL